MKRTLYVIKIVAVLAFFVLPMYAVVSNNERVYPYDISEKWCCTELTFELNIGRYEDKSHFEWQGEQYDVCVGFQGGTFEVLPYNVIKEHRPISSDVYLLTGRWKCEGDRLILKVNTDNVFGGAYKKLTFYPITDTVVAPTCTTDGYTLHECACGDSYQDSTVSKLGHSWVETGRDSMYIYSRCTRCGATRKTSVITVPIDPNPPVSEYSLGDDPEPSAASTGTDRTLISTVSEHHDYIYASGLLLRETITTTAADRTVTVETLDFTYDANGNPYALIYTAGTVSTTCYYITNLQGDVLRLVNTAGETVAEYDYDPGAGSLPSQIPAAPRSQPSTP